MKIQLIQKIKDIYFQQEQSYPPQAWVQAQASAVAGDGGVAQAGAHGETNYIFFFQEILTTQC